MIDYTLKSWDSLSNLIAAMKKDGIENIKSFDGIKLVTNKATYGLCDGKLSRVLKA